MAGLIVSQVGLGWYMTGLNYYHRWYHSAPAIHKATGLLVMVLVVLHLGARLKKGLPKASLFLRSLRHEAYGANSLLLDILALLCCLTGYSFVTSRGKPVSFFGLFDVPALIQWGKGAEPFFSRAHDILVYGTALVILRHVLERGMSALRRRRKRR
jgi:cytochrome b561